MGRIHTLAKVKYFIGIITAFPDLISGVEQRMCAHFGPIDFRTEWIPFTFTDYYVKEMGHPLFRLFLSFQTFLPSDYLIRMKRWTNYVEELYSKKQCQTSQFQPVRRPLNLDPGYVEPSKVVLATTKNYSHRLYLGHGIFAEVTLQYNHGKFHPLPWTYPDYQTSFYLDFFIRQRQTFLAGHSHAPKVDIPQGGYRTTDYVDKDENTSWKKKV